MDRVTIRPAFSGLVPTFWSKIRQTQRGGLQKKKKVSTCGIAEIIAFLGLWMTPNSLRIKRWPFFFFGDHPFGRADFVLTTLEEPINLAWCKVAFHCPAFCFSKYGNPVCGLCLVYCILMFQNVWGRHTERFQNLSRHTFSKSLPTPALEDSLLCDLIALTLSLAFSLQILRTLAAASSFLSGKAYPSLNFLPFFLSLLDPYSDYVGINISLNNSSSLLFLNVYALIS